MELHPTATGRLLLYQTILQCYLPSETAIVVEEEYLYGTIKTRVYAPRLHLNKYM